MACKSIKEFAGQSKQIFNLHILSEKLISIVLAQIHAEGQILRFNSKKFPVNFSV